MKLKFKMQKALVQQQQQQQQPQNNNSIKLEDSALHGLAAVAVAVEEADSKGGLLDNNINTDAALDVSTIKLERNDCLTCHGVHDLSASAAARSQTCGSPSISCNMNYDNVMIPKAYEPSVSESIETDLPIKFSANQCTSSDGSLLSPSATTTTIFPLGSKICPVNDQQQQQQVRVIKDGRILEGTLKPSACPYSTDVSKHKSQSPAFVALNGKQDLRITQITNSSVCKERRRPEVMPNENLVMKLGENDTQIFRAPMVSSTTNQPTTVSSVHSGVVVTVESSNNYSMRPPAAPPRMHLQQQIHGSGNGFGNSRLNKQCPSSTTTQGGNRHQSASSPGICEEPSSSIPDLGK